MFERQWFHPESQPGISSSAIKIEKHLRNKQYTNALKAICDEEGSEKSAYWSRQKARINHLAMFTKLKREEIKICFSGFWPDFDPQNNQLLDFFKSSIKDKNLRIICDQNPRLADILVESCMGSIINPDINPGATRIIFLGENVRPTFDLFDYSISFDKSSYGGRNIYLPLWLFEINLFNRTYPDRLPYDQNLFLNPISTNYDVRCNKLVFVGNNATPYRKYLIDNLPDYGVTVDHFGSQSNPVGDKLKLYSRYKAVICFENSYHPGYVTEKLIHSLLSGTDSFYWGGIDDEPFANHSLLHYIQDGERIESVAKKILKVFKKKKSAISPPILTKECIQAFKSDTTDGINRILKLF